VLFLLALADWRATRADASDAGEGELTRA
jgi:hypothetical protein